MNNTLVKGLQLLEVLAQADQPVGVSVLAEELGMGKSNVHRLLQGLVEHGYALRYEETGTYSASLKMWEIGYSLIQKLNVKNAAVAAMESLLAATRETVHLSVLQGLDVIYVHKLDSPEPVRAYSEVGGRAPAHCVATGKALLAWQSSQTIKHASANLTRYTPNTIVDAKTFTRELEKVRDQGYAVNRGEWRETVWGIGAPIRDASGGVLAAVGISGPSLRIKPGHIRAIAAHVTETADAISARLARRS